MKALLKRAGRLKVFLMACMVVLTPQVNLFANSCCGGGLTQISTLKPEYKYNLKFSFEEVETYGRIHESDDFKVWAGKERKTTNYDIIFNYNLNQTNYQPTLSIIIGYIKDKYLTNNYKSFKDLQLGLNFRVHQNTQYNLYIPNFWTGVIINTPTGKSIYDLGEAPEGVGVSGYNTWGAGVGIKLQKVYYPIKVNLVSTFLSLKGKQYYKIKVGGFYELNNGLSFNYSMFESQLDLVFGFKNTYISKRYITSKNRKYATQSSFHWPITLGLNFNHKKIKGLGLVWSDNSLIGPAKNYLLTKKFGVNYNFNY